MPRLGARAAALAAVAALAFGTSCGDEEPTDGASIAELTKGLQGTPAPNLDGEELEVSRTVERLQTAFAEGDAATYCDQLTPAGEEQVTRFGAAFGRGGDCEKTIARLAEMTNAAGGSEGARVVAAVTIDGDRAVASFQAGTGSLETGTDGRSSNRMVLVRSDGEWKIPDPGFSTDIVPPGSDPTD